MGVDGWTFSEAHSSRSPRATAPRTSKVGHRDLPEGGELVRTYLVWSEKIETQIRSVLCNSTQSLLLAPVAGACVVSVPVI